MESIREMMEEAHNTAVRKGWWEAGERNFGEQIALMHSELSEVLECWRNGDDWTVIEHSGPESNMKPEGIAVEFADVLIRIFDTCETYDIPLVQAINEKMAYNRTRPYRHGGKLA